MTATDPADRKPSYEIEPSAEVLAVVRYAQHLSDDSSRIVEWAARVAATSGQSLAAVIAAYEAVAEVERLQAENARLRDLNEAQESYYRSVIEAWKTGAAAPVSEGRDAT